MIDKEQLQEWLDSIDDLIRNESKEDVNYLIESVNNYCLDHHLNIREKKSISSDYINTIHQSAQPKYPGNIEIEQKIASYIRWNATVMVLRANKLDSSLGGHLASYASSAYLYEVGFNHFWRGNSDSNSCDLIFFQGHSSTGVYARSFLEERFTPDIMDNFRQESGKVGLSSYPHPWLMPHYWQFPTVSMGLGPLMSIYQARFLSYLYDRQLSSSNTRKVWCFIGDGETSEPETLGNIHIAGREKLDNLIYVINCNLQRLDGPVTGNGKIIQELESLFIGAKWKVIKVIWGSNWDSLLEKDKSGMLKKLMMETLDGDYQDIRSKNGKYVREKFFAKYPETLELVKDMTDDEIWALSRGGHDLEKIYSAYYEAVHNSEGMPVCILAKTVKGFGMGVAGESQNIAHQQKKLSFDILKQIRDKFELPLIDAQVESLEYLSLQNSSEEKQYLHTLRKNLGGYLPIREPIKTALQIPELSMFQALLSGNEEHSISTTMILVRMMNLLIKDKNIGKLIVPIVPDESRTFGMEGMFRQLGIWSHIGQLYKPEDSSQLMYYKESVTGQIFQEGINEPGAISTWIAAATSYANNGITMIPFYIYYSMFGFQRVGDLAWAAGDMRSKGFLIGGTAGRTTLNGEGLQHEDGHSQIQAGLIPNCESYDPCFGYELVVIVHYALKEMYVQNIDKFYYITVMNENYQHPDMPDNSETNIINGAYRFKQLRGTRNIVVNLLGSGTVFREVIFAAEILNTYNISVNIFSVTSYNKLGRDIKSINRYNLQHEEKGRPFISTLLDDASVTVSATDYIRAYSEQIREYVNGKYICLGTDGFGRSDTRAALREFFEVNRYYIALAVFAGLSELGLIPFAEVELFIQNHEICIGKLDPWDI